MQSALAVFASSVRRARLLAAVALAEQNLAPIEARTSLAEQLAATDRELSELRVRPFPKNDGTRADGDLPSLREDAATLPIVTLARRLGLRPCDEDLLWFAVALEVDPLFAITLTALAGGEPRAGISARAVAQMLRFSFDEALALRLGASHPLVASGLLESAAGSDTADTLKPWRACARVVSFLEGDTALDRELERVGEVVRVPAHARFAEAAASRDLLRRLLSDGENLIVAIEGVDGVGRRTLVADVARELGREVLAIDAGRLSMDRARAIGELRAQRRECWLRGAVPLVARLDALSRRGERSAERLADVAEALESRGAVSGPAVVTMAPGTVLPEFERRVVRLRLEAPGAAARLSIWSHALLPTAMTEATSTLAPSLQSAVQLYELTPGSIRRAADNALLIARGRDLAADDIRAGVIAEIQARFGGLATRLSITQTWDDLVLPADTLDDIKAFTSRARSASLVYDGWGFREKLGRGLGLAALFSGPPGTGKTMVAGLIARALGLELYQVDLSQVVSKWVGETEKQLGKIFDAASMGHALLLFDEADALFARRTEVKSSNDRYANLEVNYLLQRIEHFGGVAILTTNLEATVDPAFKRRLAADVRFYPPEREERRRLWRTLLPPLAPLEGTIDFAALADVYKDMCGGHIRNAILRAAFLAAGADERAITQSHLERAAHVEYRAMGKVF